jgi:hypothetical protein
VISGRDATRAVAGRPSKKEIGMKRFGWILFLALVVVTPLFAEEEADKFKFSGEVRARWEWLDNMLDFNDADTADDSYDIIPYRVRFGVNAQLTDDVSGFVEVQNFGLFGDEPPFKSNQNPNGQFEESADLEDTNLYQGYVQLDNIIQDWDFDLRIGRQEHTLGYELQMGDSDFYNGLSFDGIRGMWNFDKWGLGAFYYRIGDLPCSTAPCPIDDDDSTFAGVTANFALGDNGMVLEPYIMNFQNQSEVNTVFLDKINFMTLGARFSRPIETRDDVADGFRFDWNAEVAIQDGDIGPVGAEGDHSASIVEGWFGFNWATGDTGRSRVHVGTLITSGDEEDAGGLADDGDHEDYLFLFTDTHANNRLGDSDLETTFFSFADSAFGTFFSSGVTNFNAGYEYVGESHGFMASFHMFTLTEENCVGTISGGCQDDLGQEVDVRYGYKYNEVLGFEVGLADFMPGDAIADSVAFGNDDDAMRLWGQARLRF